MKHSTCCNINLETENYKGGKKHLSKKYEVPLAR